MRALVLGSVIAAVAVAACQRSTNVELRKDAARICRDGQSLVVVRQSGERQYHFLRATLDSADLLRTIQTILPPRPNKVVLVDVEPGHTHAPRWLVAAIQEAGGDAFEPDSACLLPAFRIGAHAH